ALAGGGTEVHPARRDVLGDTALRHGADLRRDRHDLAAGDRHGDGERAQERQSAAGRRRDLHLRWPRLQGLRRAVPYVGARHLWRLADTFDALLLHRVEGGWLRGAVTHLRLRWPRRDR